MSRNPTLAPASAPLHVAIVSGDPLVRAGLASIIEPELGSGRIVDDLDQADVALWDTGANLDQVLGHLAQFDSVDIPVLAVVPSASFAGPALDAGAGGVVLRDRLGEGLAAALAAVRHGFVVLDAALAAGLTDTTFRTPGRRRSGAGVGHRQARIRRRRPRCSRCQPWPGVSPGQRAWPRCPHCA